MIYWAEDGTAPEKTPSGAIWHGTWRIDGNTLCPTWKEKPGTGCVHYDKTGDTVSVAAANGKVRAKVVKSAASNAEHRGPETSRPRQQVVAISLLSRGRGLCCGGGGCCRVVGWGD